MNEGDHLEMTELVLQEKELKAKIGVLDERMKEPVEKLRRMRAILDKAKAAYQASLDAVKPLQSDKMLLEGELELLLEKKSVLRQEARMRESGGIRPGTAALVEQMKGLVGDTEAFRLAQETKAAGVESDLAALKDKMGSES